MDQINEDPGHACQRAGAREGLSSRSYSASPAPRQEADPIRLLIEAVAIDRWRVSAGGDVLLESAREPLCDGARALIARGVDPAARLTMRRGGTDHDCFEPRPVGMLARLTVEESATRSVHFRRWRPMPRSVRESGAVAASGASDVSPYPDGGDAVCDAGAA